MTSLLREMSECGIERGNKIADIEVYNASHEERFIALA